MTVFAKRSITKKDVIQFLKFMVGGSTYFWSGYAVFALCYSGFGWDWLPAKMLADVVGFTLNYFIQRHWAFVSDGLKKKEGQTVSRYTLISIFSLGLDYAIIAGLNALGVSPYIGFFISSGFFTVWNYVWYRFWVFMANAKKAKGAL